MNTTVNHQSAPVITPKVQVWLDANPILATTLAADLIMQRFSGDEIQTILDIYQNTAALLTTAETAARFGKHVVTVRLALSDQSLHGSQTKVGGRWLVDEDCAEAWARGEKCDHRTRAYLRSMADRMDALAA